MRLSSELQSSAVQPIMTLTATVTRSATHATLLRSTRVTLRSPAPFRPIRGPGAVRMAKTLTVALSQDELKKQAAHKAVEYAESGMVLGLGTGSTTAFAIDRIGELMKKGELKDIVGVPTSIKSYEQASGGFAFIQAFESLSQAFRVSSKNGEGRHGRIHAATALIATVFIASRFGNSACYSGRAIRNRPGDRWC